MPHTPLLVSVTKECQGFFLQWRVHSGIRRPKQDDSPQITNIGLDRSDFPLHLPAKVCLILCTILFKRLQTAEFLSSR